MPLRRRLPVVDGLVAGVTDHEGLASCPGHECRPCRLVCDEFVELRPKAVPRGTIGYVTGQLGEIADWWTCTLPRLSACSYLPGGAPGGQLRERVDDHC